MSPRAFGIVAAGLLLSAPPLAGQAVLMGVVRADSTGKPLQGVEVLIERSAFRATTDGAGRYVFPSVPAGRYTALFRSVGFRPVRQAVVLVAADTIWANAELVPSTVELEPIVVTEAPARPRGLGVEAFEERRKLGFGRFIDSTELRRKDHLRLGHALGGSGQHVYAVSGRRFGPMAGMNCYMSIYLDGSLLYRSPGPPNMGSKDMEPDPIDLNTFRAGELEAVEIYASAAAVPIEFSGASSACGVVVLWSRRGP